MTDSGKIHLGGCACGLKLRRHIHVADKAGSYETAGGLEQVPQGQGGDTWLAGRSA